MTQKDWADWVYSIGTALGGLGTVGLLGAAIYGIRSAGRWRGEQRETLRAAAAAEAIVALCRMVDGLKYVANPTTNSAPPSQNYATSILAATAQRRADIREIGETFNAAWARTEAVLSEEAVTFFKRVQGISAEMHAGLATWAGLYVPGSGASPGQTAQAAEFWKKAVGVEVEKALDQVYADAKAKLRPIAQFSQG